MVFFLHMCVGSRLLMYLNTHEPENELTERWSSTQTPPLLLLRYPAWTLEGAQTSAIFPEAFPDLFLEAFPDRFPDLAAGLCHGKHCVLLCNIVPYLGEYK